MIGRRAQLSHGGVCLLLRPAQFRAQGADRVGVLNSRLLYLCLLYTSDAADDCPLV